MINCSTVQDYVASCRSYIQTLREVEQMLGLLQQGGEDMLNFTYNSRVSYFVDLARRMCEMGAEALYEAANLAPKAPRIGDGETLREWRFDDDGEIHEIGLTDD